MELESERVIIEAPMSFTGSAKRIWRLSTIGWVRALLVVLIATAWIIVLLWYCTFGLLLVPYRLVRRSSRKQKRDALRHREMLEIASGVRPPVAYAQPTTPPTSEWPELPQWSR